MSDDGQAAYLAEGARRLGIDLDPDRTALFGRYLELLQSERQNISGVSSPREIVEKHFIDSLTVVLAADVGPGLPVLDVGSGAGFPGVPLKILRPGIRLVLLEPRLKRALFLENVVTELDLGRVTVVRMRAEDFLHDAAHREKFLLVTARAVAPLAALAEYCLPALAPGGRLVALKGPEAARELEEAKGALSLLGGGKARLREVFLPYSGATRNLIVVDKVQSTPPDFPRAAGIPSRRPLGGRQGKRRKAGNILRTEEEGGE